MTQVLSHTHAPPQDTKKPRGIYHKTARHALAVVLLHKQAQTLHPAQQQQSARCKTAVIAALPSNKMMLCPISNTASDPRIKWVLLGCKPTLLLAYQAAMLAQSSHSQCRHRLGNDPALHFLIKTAGTWLQLHAATARPEVRSKAVPGEPAGADVGEAHALEVHHLQPAAQRVRLRGAHPEQPLLAERGVAVQVLRRPLGCLQGIHPSNHNLHLMHAVVFFEVMLPSKPMQVQV